MVILSILIPSLYSRKELLKLLLDRLENQLIDAGLTRAETGFQNSHLGFTIWSNNDVSVEVMTFADNKERTTGAKRQELLQWSLGKYIVFIDDDDEIMPCYIAEMIKGCQSGVDCLAINGIITTNGKDLIKWYLSKDNDNKTVKRAGRKVYMRTTNHITAVKRSIALQAGFPDKSNAEDKAYSDALKGLLHTEYTVEPCMYHYKFISYNKEY